MLVTKQSVVDQQFYTMSLPVTEEQLAAYENCEGLVQDIFPNLTLDQREFLMTGLTPEKWNELFGDDE